MREQAQKCAPVGQVPTEELAPGDLGLGFDSEIRELVYPWLGRRACRLIKLENAENGRQSQVSPLFFFSPSTFFPLS